MCNLKKKKKKELNFFSTFLKYFDKHVKFNYSVAQIN